jgi:hypothetical protein
MLRQTIPTNNGKVASDISNSYQYGDGGEGQSGIKLSYRILYQKLYQKSFVLITTNIYGLQESLLKQLWYLHAVLFHSPAA